MVLETDGRPPRQTVVYRALNEQVVSLEFQYRKHRSAGSIQNSVKTRHYKTKARIILSHILSLTNELKSIDPLQGQLGEYLYGKAISNDSIRTVTLVVEEILVNVISHGYPDPDGHSTIELAVSVQDGLIELTFCDDATLFNPLVYPSPTPAEERIVGWGLPLVRHLCSKTRYLRVKNQNVLQVEITLSVE